MSARLGTGPAAVRGVRWLPVGTWGPVAVGLVLIVWALAVPFGFTAALTALTAVGMTMVAIGLFRPEVGLVGAALLCVIDAPSRVYLLTGGLLRFNTFNYLLLLVAIVGLPVLLRMRGAPIRFLVATCVLMTVEVVISPDLDFGLQHLLNLFSTFGLLVYFIYGGRSSDVWRWQAVIAGLVAAGAGLVYYMQQLSLAYINPNSWAQCPLAGLVALCLGFPFARSGRQQAVMGALAAVNVAWVLLSGSRGSLLVALMCVLYLTAVTPGVTRRTLLVTGLLIIGMSGATLFGNLQDAAVRRVTRLIDPSVPLVSRTSGRSDLALGGWYIFSAHPFGVGTGGFAAAWAELRNREGLSRFEEGAKFQAHAGWIKTLAENGAPGIVLLASFVISFAIAGLRADQPHLRLIGFLASAVLGSAWISMEFQSKGLWLLAAGTMALLGGAVPRAGAAQMRTGRAGKLRPLRKSR